MARRRKRKRATAVPAAPAAARADRAPGSKTLDPRPVLFGLVVAAAVAIYPESMKWIGFAALVALALLDLAWQLARGKTPTIDVVDLILAALIGFGALSLLWSANVNGGIQTAIIAVAALVLAIHLKSIATPAILFGLCAGVAVGDAAAFATSQWLQPGQWLGFANRGYAGEFFMLSAPFLWPLWKAGPRWLKAVAAAMALADLAVTDLLAHHLGLQPSMIQVFVVGTFVAIGSIVFCFRRGAVTGWFGVAAWIVTPVAVTLLLRDTRLFGYLMHELLVRTELWLNCGFMFADKPAGGFGLGSFIEIYPLYKESHGDLMPFVNTAFESYVTEAEAAHNDPVQLLTELGLIGFVPFLSLAALALRSAARRAAADPFAAAGGAALVTILAESLLEYPLQRCATLMLATIALAFATRGEASGLRRWRVALPRPARLAVAAAALAAAPALCWASYVQFVAETEMDQARAQGIDPVQAFNLVWDAHLRDPLERRIRTALPIYVDGVVRARGPDAVPASLAQRIYAAVDQGGRYNSAALVARIQDLLQKDNGDDPEFKPLMDTLKLGSKRVAAVYALEARYQLVHGLFVAALATAREGKKYTEGVSAIPSADHAIAANLDDLERTAQAQLAILQQMQQQQRPAPEMMRVKPPAAAPTPIPAPAPAR